MSKYFFLTLILSIVFLIPTNTSAYESVNFQYNNQPAGVFSSFLNLFTNTSNAQTPDITTGLVGHWSFDETSGATASDSSGNGNDGTLTNMDPATDWVTGQIDGGLDFNGTDDYVAVSDPLYGATQMSVSLWMKSGGGNTDNQDDIITNKSGWNNPGVSIVPTSSDTKILVRLEDVQLVTNTDTWIDVWAHLVVTYDGSDLIIYRDGVQIKLSTPGSQTIYGSGSTRIGASLSAARYNGTIDDVRVYNRALSVEEATELYNIGFGDIPVPTCTSFTYTDWSPTTCPIDEIQTRTVQTSSPTDCTGGIPITSQSCTYTPLTSDTEDPSIPTNLQATSISVSQINLSWTASTDNTAVTGYNIYRDGSIITNTAGTAYSNAGLSPSTAYLYNVTALDSVGNESGLSTNSFGTTQDLPQGAGKVITPLIVTNQLDINQNQKPVTAGIPLPVNLNITDTNSLMVESPDRQTFVPAQFRVLSRWGDLSDVNAPIKWVLVDFQADVSAQSNTTYYLSQGTQNQFNGIVTMQDATEILVDTGRLKLKIAKDKFNLFDQIIVIDPNDSSETEIVSSLLGNGIRIDRNGVTHRSSLNSPDSITVEESGPLRTVIHVTGKYQNDNGEYFIGGDARVSPSADGRPASNDYPLEYSVRIHAYKDKSYVKVFYTLENNGNGWANYYPFNDVFIDGLYLDLETELNGSVSFMSDTTNNSLSSSDNISILQTHTVNDKHDESQNFSYNVSKNGISLITGDRSDGWIDINNGQSGVAVGLKYFWQEYPKSIEVNGNTISIGLLPEYNQAPEQGYYASGNFYFSGGWHKTNELVYYFHDTQKTKTEIEGVIDGFNKPLVAMAPSTWYSSTNAWSLIAPRTTKPNQSTIQEDAIEAYEQINQVLIDPTVSVDSIDLESIRESRGSFGSSYFDEEYYGWEDFGDLVWKYNANGQHSALHYDWPYIMWLQMIRSGDTRYFNVAEEMTRHSVDMDQVHIESTGAAINADGLWWSEDIKGHHKSPAGYAAIVSHTWNGGYSLGYLLTGDERYLEASSRSADMGNRFWFDNKDVGNKNVAYDQTRSQGWSILMLLNLYKITGDISLLQDAMTIFTNSLLYTEQLPDAPGSNGGGYITTQGANIVTFLTYPLEPLSELHYEAKIAGLDVGGLEAYIIRSLGWLKDYAYVGGVTRIDGLYSALTISYSTDPDSPLSNLGGVLAHNIHVAGAFGYGYTMLKDSNPALAQSYLGFARNLFKDSMFYQQAVNPITKDDYFDPNIRAPIKYLYFTSATKEMGYIGRGGQFYLNAEYNYSGQDLPPSISADLNSDGLVNSIDWSIMNTAWGTNNPTADLNNDSIVNSLDWSVMNGQWSS